MVIAEVYMLLEVLSLEIYPIATAFHPSHMSRLTGSDRSPLYQQMRPPVRTDVPRTLPPRTPYNKIIYRFLERHKSLGYRGHFPSQADMNAKHWPMTY